jgi:uncharacterized membrane protein YqjE
METEPEQDESFSGVHPLQLIRILRLCGRLLAGHLASYGQLAYVEWELEKRRLGQVALLACACAFFLLLSAIYLIALSLSLIWDSPHRAVFLSGFAIFFGALAFFVWRRISALWALGADRFANLSRELGATLDILRNRP